MPSAKDVFVRCDELANLPEPSRQNYLAELGILENVLPQGGDVLQVGSMDGQRLIRLLQMRPDLHAVGLDIEADLVELAEANVDKADIDVAFVLGDILKPPLLPHFDYVLCLNNTLGYIADEDTAIDEMRRLGTNVVISVYGEAFDDSLAHAYFKALGLEVDSIEDDLISVADWGTVKRFTREGVQAWRGKVTDTPIGYLIEL